MSGSPLSTHLNSCFLCVFSFPPFSCVPIRLRIILQGCLELGCAPEGVSWQIDVTPVDFAARAMVHVAVEQPVKSLGHVGEKHILSTGTS